MESTNVNASLSVLLTVLFIGLKLTHVIAWSWLWVLSPLWISAALAVVIWLAVAAILFSR